MYVVDGFGLAVVEILPSIMAAELKTNRGVEAALDAPRTGSGIRRMRQFEFEGDQYEYQSERPATVRTESTRQTGGDTKSLLLIMPQSTGPQGTVTFVDSLARQHQVIQYQQLGASRAGRSIDMQGLGAQAGALIDHLGDKPVHLICHSTGCGIGLYLATARPDRVASLVLITPWTHADQHLQALQTLRQTIARTLDDEQYERFNASLLFPPAYRRQHQDAFTALARTAASRPRDIDSFVARLDAILAFDARQLWTDVSCPTLVIGAEDDQLMPVWFSEATADGIDQAQLMLVENGGHMLPETRGVDIAERINTFLLDFPAS